MYIKYVRIQGFKSYREKVVCGPLSPMHNSIVGMNGSGKSNFFAALRFVLSDAYSNMRPEERAKLLNDGAGPSLVSAYVEIVFDNSDHRLDNEKDEVTIRRQIGLKKDEYFIDNKHVTKQDIANMLETAGFSKSNPYYIVEQGKVTKITEMTDKARLELLKEVAGTNVYEEKKEESLKIMKESDAKMVEIKKNLDMIEDRLAKLDAEKEELSQYYSLDKERRSLQHSLLSQKIKGLHEELTGIEHDRQSIRADSTQNDQDKQKLDQQAQELERKIESLVKQEERLANEKNALEEDEKQKLKEEHRQTMRVGELQRKVNSDLKEHDSKAKRLAQLQSQITVANDKLSQLLPAIEKANDTLQRTTRQYHEVDQELINLAAIQGNAQQFKSKTDRDNHLKTQIKSLEADIVRRKADEQKLDKEIKLALKTVTETTAAKVALQDKLQKSRENRPAGSEKLKQLEAQRLEVVKQQKEQQRRLDEMLREKDSADIKLQGLNSTLMGSMPPPAAKALRFLQKYVEEKKIQGYYGPVIDLFECPESCNIAVEQVGGARLFNIVVQDDNIASTLMAALQRAKEGRTQFLPLSRLKPEVPSFPANLSGAKPLISCMKFDSKFKPAMLEIFGKTLLCDGYDVASECRRNHDLACVTLEGDKFSKKGSIKGGYHDKTKSPIAVQKQIKKEEANLQKLRSQHEDASSKCNELQQTNAKITGEYDKLKNELTSAGQNDEEDKKRLESLRRDISDAQEIVEENRMQLQRLQEDRQELERKCSSLSEQLSSPFAQSLTAEQEARVKKLTEEHTDLQKQRANLDGQLNLKTQEKRDLEGKISGLKQNVDSLQDELDSLAGASRGELEMEQVQLKSIQAIAQGCRDQREQKEAELERAKQSLAMAKSDLRKVQDEQKKHGSDIESAKKRLDQLQEKKNRLLGEIDAAQAQLRELGSLPEAFEKYKNRNHKQLVDDLHKVTEKLKAFKDVNKKALDQFNQFTEQREKFRERRDELDRGAGSIRELIAKLDEKKDEAIQNTFRMVAKNFREVFKLLVPGGSGELVMKTSDRAEGADDDDDDGDDGAQGEPASRHGQSRLRTYVGVSVKVRFAAGGEVRVMRGLSGGQKTVVALGIIFSIQKCDPAPFYLFDEVDANLDPMYRAALASMISKQKMGSDDSHVQFITSSFQPELAQAADSHWLTTHSGMSRIVKGTIEDQIAVIKENQKTLTSAQPA